MEEDFKPVVRKENIIYICDKCEKKYSHEEYRILYGYCGCSIVGNQYFFTRSDDDKFY